MTILAVDDEEFALLDLVDAISAARPDAKIVQCRNGKEALEAAKNDTFEVAFLDIEIGSMTGLKLAKLLKDIQPKINIIFATSYQKYAVDAFALHASGYLLKPVSKEDVERELSFVYVEEPTNKKNIRVQTFGGFDIFVDDKPVTFKRAKSKELLAYLIDRRGNSVSLGQAADVMFEDGIYDSNRKKYMQTIYAGLCADLKAVGADSILQKSHNCHGVDVNAFECDYYKFLDGDAKAVNQYRGDYMINYSWSEYSIGNFDF